MCLYIYIYTHTHTHTHIHVFFLEKFCIFFLQFDCLFPKAFCQALVLRSPLTITLGLLVPLLG